MRKLLIASLVALALALFVVPAAEGHGTGNINAFVNKVGSSVIFTGSAGNTQPHLMTIKVYAQRRNGPSTGPFSDFDSQTATANGTSISKAFSKPFDCSKDYRTRVVLSQNGHSNITTVSSVLQNTC